jgi:hypothetical protein
MLKVEEECNYICIQEHQASQYIEVRVLCLSVSAKCNTFCCSRFELLQSLTENGKDIRYFEEEVGPFLLRWMAAVIGVARTKEFLSMLVNVIKFNAAYVDEDVISGLVQ